MDIDGKDGVVVIDKANKVLTVNAVYYVNTQKVDGQKTSVYSAKQIEGMNSSINKALNSKGYSVSEGEFAGYSVEFNLQFKDGGNIFSTDSKIGSDKIDGHSISNSFSQGDDSVISRFKTQENEDGTTSTVGGVTEHHNKVTMNSSQDTKHNRIHEIFHTLFFDNDGATEGIGSYNNPQMPDQNDINTMINNTALPKVEPQKKDDENK